MTISSMLYSIFFFGLLCRSHFVIIPQDFFLIGGPCSWLPFFFFYSMKVRLLIVENMEGVDFLRSRSPCGQ